MRTVSVNTSRPYQIKIGSGCLDTIGKEALALGKANKICVVSDTTVFPLYGQIVLDSLTREGFHVDTFVFPAGEASKNATTFLSLLNRLAQLHLTRSDLIVALGGGVVGDLAGFAAACYLRGIRFIQAPTTLLAAVDSSVGGKTAIDLPAGKNLAGAFWQPSLVLCDIDTLGTLPEDIFQDGCAEVIKYAILYDPELFEELMHSGIHFDRESVITRCIIWKRDVVVEDEFDSSSRMKLNLGHTLGHAVESLSDFTLSHGKGVSMGMTLVARSAFRRDLCSEACCQQILAILKRFHLPTESDYTADQIFTAALSDKKRSGDHIQLIIPRDIGRCDITPIPIEELNAFIKAGL